MIGWLPKIWQSDHLYIGAIKWQLARAQHQIKQCSGRGRPRKYSCWRSSSSRQLVRPHQTLRWRTTTLISLSMTVGTWCHHRSKHSSASLVLSLAQHTSSRSVWSMIGWLWHRQWWVGTMIAGCPCHGWWLRIGILLWWWDIDSFSLFEPHTTSPQPTNTTMAWTSLLCTTPRANQSLTTRANTSWTVLFVRAPARTASINYGYARTNCLDGADRCFVLVLQRSV